MTIVLDLALFLCEDLSDQFFCKGNDKTLKMVKKLLLQPLLLAFKIVQFPYSMYRRD